MTKDDAREGTRFYQEVGLEIDRMLRLGHDPYSVVGLLQLQIANILRMQQDRMDAERESTDEASPF